MSKKANPTLIGAFALGAIALAVAALVIFGSGKFFTRHPRAVAFFQGNIQGLNVGAAVNLRGVQIGTVTEIRIEVDTKTMVPTIPVYMEFDPSRLIIEKGDVGLDFANQQPLKSAITTGLHARLATQSMVTGQLLVELDFDPNEPSRLTGKDPKTVEIPTTESDIEKLKNVLARVPIDEIAGNVQRVLEDVHRLTSSPELTDMLRSLAVTSREMESLVADARKDIGPLTKSTEETLTASQAALGELRTTLTTANQLMNSDIRESVRTATDTMRKADKAMGDTASLLAPNSPQRYNIDQILRNLDATTRSLRSFADQLERRPNAIVIGK